MILLEGELHTDESDEVVIPFEGAFDVEDITTIIVVIVQSIELVVQTVVLKLKSDLDAVADTEIESETCTDTRAESSILITGFEAIVACHTKEYIGAEETLRIVAENMLALWSSCKEIWADGVL